MIFFLELSGVYRRRLRLLALGQQMRCSLILEAVRQRVTSARGMAQVKEKVPEDVGSSLVERMV